MTNLPTRAALLAASLPIAVGGAFVAPTVASAAPESPPTSTNILSNNGRSCVPLGSFGDWRAQKYLYGRYVSPGPRRWTKAKAQADCRYYVFGF